MYFQGTKEIIAISAHMTAQQCFECLADALETFSVLGLLCLYSAEFLMASDHKFVDPKGGQNWLQNAMGF